MKIKLNELKRIVRQTIREAGMETPQAEERLGSYGPWLLTLEFDALAEAIDAGMRATDVMPGAPAVSDWLPHAIKDMHGNSPTREDLIDAKPSSFSEEDWEIEVDDAMQDM